MNHLNPGLFPGLGFYQGPVLLRGPGALRGNEMMPVASAATEGPVRALWRPVVWLLPGARLTTEGHATEGAERI